MEKATQRQERKEGDQDAGARRAPALAGTGGNGARRSAARKRLSPSAILEHEYRCQERSLREFS
jgi:hypothetical protein